MSRHLFYSAVLLLVLVMMCCNAGGAAEAPERASEPKVKWKDITEVGEGVTVESLGAPGLLNVGSDVFAVAEAQCKEEGQDTVFTGIASQLITIDNDKEKEEVMKDASRKTQFLEDGSADPKKKVDVSRPTIVMKGNDIYMLVGKYSRNDAQESGGGDSGLLLVEGEVSEEENNKKIDWKNTESLPRGLLDTELISWTGLIGGGGSGVLTDDGTLLFPVEGTKSEAPKGEKTVSLIIYSLKDTNNWKLSKGIPDGGCSDPSVVEWGEKDKKLIMMMTACDGGRRRVYESDDKGELWTEALGTLSRVWSNKKCEEVKTVRSGFITATIDGDENNRNVMLVTLPVYSEKADKKETGNGKGKLHLWLTDNTHIVDIGPVPDDDAAASSLLYKSGKDGDKKEELIALYEKKKGDEGKPSRSLWSVLLAEQL
ncbi:trans-sialidase, partial [Trypanosoma cruzi]